MTTNVMVYGRSSTFGKGVWALEKGKHDEARQVRPRLVHRTEILQRSVNQVGKIPKHSFQLLLYLHHGGRVKGRVGAN